MIASVIKHTSVRAHEQLNALAEESFCHCAISVALIGYSVAVPNKQAVGDFGAANQFSNSHNATVTVISEFSSLIAGDYGHEAIGSIPFIRAQSSESSRGADLIQSIVGGDRHVSVHLLAQTVVPGVVPIA